MLIPAPFIIINPKPSVPLCTFFVMFSATGAAGDGKTA